MPSANDSATRTRVPFGTLALLVALIGWGLQYKTSLILAEQDDSLCRMLLLPAKILIDTDDCLLSKVDVVSCAAHKVRSITATHYQVTECDCVAAQCESYLLTASQHIADGTRFSRRFFIRPPPLS